MRQALVDIVRLVSIADSAGAPIEMYCREDILKNLNSYLLSFPKREHPYDIGCQPGEYTDDTQMSIAVTRYLLRLSKNPSTPFSFETFMKDLLDIYDEDKTEKGIERGGHGTFEKIAKFNGDRIAFQAQNNKKRYMEWSQKWGKQDNIDHNIGNGSGMRLNPFMVADLSKETLTEHLIGMTLSTHNNAIAVIANILMVNILKALYNNIINSNDVITYSLSYLLQFNTYPYYTCDLTGTKQIFDSLTQTMPCINDFDTVINLYIGYLAQISQLSKCNKDLSNIDHLQISLKHAPHCVKKGGTGMPVEALQTIGWFHYLIANLKSCDNALDVLKRCLLVGGDTDTIAAYVYPISYIVFKRDKENVELPDYIMTQLLESDIQILDKRIGL